MLHARALQEVEDARIARSLHAEEVHYLDVCVCLSVCASVCLCVCVCVCMYVYVYVNKYYLSSSYIYSCCEIGCVVFSTTTCVAYF
jgi:hypothetical protein